MPILKEELDALSKYGILKTEMPEVITAKLNPTLAKTEREFATKLSLCAGRRADGGFRKRLS